ncbi:DUF1800 domain-containing protein [Shewanella sp. GXUN23E]|uniref:DUF1800 domain-containing protein n=1 Tax=Shewanella sp. GXUN23E TaxID=3422498 RepID=UPI003D7ED7C8
MDFQYSQTVLACQRLGFGPLPGELADVRVLGARRWLEVQLTAPLSKHADLQALPSSQQILLQIDSLKNLRKQAQGAEAKRAAQHQVSQYLRQTYLEQMAARASQTLTTRQGFNERLVQFWSNHFAVSGDARQVRALTACIENEVIRPGFRGNFAALLIAVIQHPAMLLYLDNAVSTGPDSAQGENALGKHAQGKNPQNKKKGRGLNENLAREILELHTLGVNGGYQQQDVRQLAHALTGWTVVYKGKRAGTFGFVAGMHQPGDVTVLGNCYSGKGIEQARSCLQDLALHPETARHLAGKLSQHFIGRDDGELVDELTRVYLQHKGELLPVYQALISHPSVWQAQKVRFRPPQLWLFAALRGGALIADCRSIQRALMLLGQQPFYAGSPAGWSDRDSDYNSPSALMQRWQVAGVMAGLLLREAKFRGDEYASSLYSGMLDNVFEGEADEHLTSAVRQAQDPVTALTLLWLSPQFQYC